MALTLTSSSGEVLAAPSVLPSEGSEEEVTPRVCVSLWPVTLRTPLDECCAESMYESKAHLARGPLTSTACARSPKEQSDGTVRSRSDFEPVERRVVRRVGGEMSRLGRIIGGDA
eukprot:2417799-Pleurochrysis_carterae.AAC.1